MEGVAGVYWRVWPGWNGGCGWGEMEGVAGV